MPKNSKQFPFDERNEEDYQKISKNIDAALMKISLNISIPATQDKLATLSGCSRKTLYNRKWAIEALRKIKLERKSENNKIQIKKNPSKEEDTSIENYKIKIDSLIKNYQSENGLLFDKIQDLEEQNKELISLNKVFAEDKESLIKENAQLRKELHKLQNKPESISNVIDFIR
jgi:chromosome segregation ATPase